MQWLSENWLLLLIGGGMAAMHLFGHRHGHKDGGHTSPHGSSKKTETPDLETTVRSEEEIHG